MRARHSVADTEQDGAQTGSAGPLVALGLANTALIAIPTRPVAPRLKTTQRRHHRGWLTSDGPSERTLCTPTLTLGINGSQAPEG